MAGYGIAKPGMLLQSKTKKKAIGAKRHIEGTDDIDIAKKLGFRQTRGGPKPQFTATAPHGQYKISPHPKTGMHHVTYHPGGTTAGKPIGSARTPQAAKQRAIGHHSRLGKSEELVWKAETVETPYWAHEMYEGADTVVKSMQKREREMSDRYWAHEMYEEENTIEKAIKLPGAIRGPAKTAARKVGAAVATKMAKKPLSYPADIGKKPPKQPPSMALHTEAKKLFSAKKGERAMAGITCPHCEEEISRGYAVKSLAILAKAEGHNFDDELESLAGMSDLDSTEKGGPKGPTHYTGNQTSKKDVERGKPGKKHHTSLRTKGEAIQRKNTPTNPVTETTKKSLNFPITDDVRLVNYTHGFDEAIAKGVVEGSHHVPPAPNLRAEQELSQLAAEE